MLESGADHLAEPTLALARRLMGQRDVIFAYIAAIKDALNALEPRLERRLKWSSEGLSS